jgi:uncharacterized Zn finger protein
MNTNELKININPSDVKNVECESCGGVFFKQVVLLKRIPKLAVGADEDVLAPVVVWRCDDCGGVNEEFIPKSVKKNDKGNSSTKSGLII